MPGFKRSEREWNKLAFLVPMKVACQPPRSRARRSSPRPEKLPKEKVLRVGETSSWSSWSRNGIPIRRCRFFPVWWKGMEPFLSRSSRRFLNWKVQNFPRLDFDLQPATSACGRPTFLKMFMPRSEARSGTACRRRLVRETFAKVSVLRDFSSSLHFRLMSCNTQPR